MALNYSWALSGSGWAINYDATVTISVSRAYGSDTARVTASGSMHTPAGNGDSNATWKFWIKIGSATYTKTISSGYHAPDRRDSFSYYWDINVGATGGTLSGSVDFQAYDYNLGFGQWASEYGSNSLLGWSQAYGTKGASTISSVSPTNVTLKTDGTATCTVNFVSYSSSFTHYTSAALVGGTASTATYSVAGGDSVAKSMTITFPTGFIDQITASKTGTATVTLSTFAGSTYIGHDTYNITLTVPDGLIPTVTIHSITKSAVVSNPFSNIICTLLDAVLVTWSFYPSYSSQLNTGVIYVDGVAGTNTDGYYTSGVITNSGSRPVVATGSDYRGNVGSDTEYFGAYEYFYPAIDVKYSHSGSSYQLLITGKIAYLNSASAQTTKQLRLSIYKGETPVSGYTNINLDSQISTVAGSTDYTKYYAINYTYNIPNTAITDIATETYKFVVTVTDTMASNSAQVYSGIPVMTLNAGGIGVTVRKPLSFDYPNGYLHLHAGSMNSSINLDNIQYTTYGWCDNVVNKPAYTSRWGYFICFEITQLYLDYDSTGMIPYIRSNVNGGWSPWRCLLENDWHSDNAVWDNSVGLLVLGRQYNGKWIRVTQSASSYPSNSPYGAATAVYYRLQIMDYVNNTLQYAIVELHEVYPVPGRIISQAYDYGQNSWRGWKIITPS